MGFANDQIADIAPRNGLGRPEAVYGVATGDRELHLFEHGAVVRLADGQLQALRWEAVTVLKDVIDPFRSVYTLSDGASPPVVIDGFDRPEEWGPAIHGAVLRAHLPQVRAALQAGRTVAFGEIAAGQQALLTPGGALPWAQISQVRLTGRLIASAGWAERFCLLRELLTAWLRPVHGPDDLIMRAWWRLQDPAGPPTVAALAGELGVSRRYVELGFRRAVGLSPKTVARIARFQRAVAAWRRPCATLEAAAACGFADQPHLSREVRTMAGMTPGQLFACVQDTGRLAD